jgi:methionyl-tRNA formyltransferase
LQDDFVIQAVITKPAPPHYHGDVPVAKLAQELGLTTYFVSNKQALSDLFKEQGIMNNIRLGVLVDFGIIVPQSVLERFELGVINSHFSLLPEWRGADPITFAILSGQEVTGISLMVIVEAMDEGPLLAQQSYTLAPDITSPELTDSLIKLSNHTIASVLPAFIEGSILATPQDTSAPATYSRKLTKEDGKLDWEKPAEQLEREIRAYVEWPRSHALINGVRVIVTRAHVTHVTGQPGTIESIDKQLIIHCGEHSLVIDRLKPASKKDMNGADFLLGYPLK